MTTQAIPNRSKLAIAATYASRAAALSVYDLLRAQGFEHAWLATTTPSTDGIAARPEITEKRSLNDITDSSEGVLGTIGRFFSGEGNSLRRSLEDHGVDPLDASEIDDDLPPLGAVVTTFGDDRPQLAAEIMRDGATRVYVPPGVPSAETLTAGAVGSMAGSVGGTAGAAAGAPGTSTIVSRELVDAAPVPGVPGAVEEVFIERRIVMSDPATTSEPRSTGLNDLL